MLELEPQISNNKIIQVFLLGLILLFLGIIAYNLSDFLPSLLGAITLYIISRTYNFYLIEKRNWKPWVAALIIILACLVVIILPSYFIIDMLITKIGDASKYTEQFNGFLDKIHNYIFEKTGFNVLSASNKEKIGSFVTKFSAAALNTTVNAITILASTFFILYFMLTKGRVFERILTSISPLKRSNDKKIGEKFRKMVIANAVGIPVVALGQAIVALIGYLIFGAPSPLLLFALTFVGAMIPIVGAAIVYVPIGIFMLANGDTTGGIGVLVYSLVIVGLVDNILRFTVLKKLENIHPLNTVFGIIMGLKIFGFMGLIFGPILISITALLIQIYHDEFSDNVEEKTVDLIHPTTEEPLVEKKIDLEI